MPKIIITDECARAIRMATDKPFRQTGVKLPDGRWEIPLDPDVYFALRSKQLEGETFSDTILRAIAAERGFN